ncbi:hypothetical protein C9374_007428 [Naegleria lovaniensis]|uniref:DH domain-containing protein n=1 Tax=Naegleria lovaniensis TaxID=51637 RepID=A0AA88KLU2_NAELO|nr:uncharacterized protein C9374_007428 [Naegleria lovaniensis]KAG2379289.1 hypothetical protein C9374_007428 [Naegleria lovaniensis]
MSAQGRKRQKILEEVIETEEEYVNNLDTLLQVYEKPLLEKGEELGFTKSMHIKVFNDLGPIRNTNGRLLADLKKLMEEEKEMGKKPEKTIGEIFLKYAPFLKSYTTYCNQYNNIATILRNVKKEHPELDKFLLAQQKSGLHGVNNRALNSFLILPVQRIPRYKMLLSELLSKTSQYHKDFTSLTEALKAVSDIADYVNEKIRAFESEERLVSLFSLFEEDMIKDGMEEKEMSEKQTRRYQMEVLKNVKFFSYSKHLKMQKVNFYLFNDLILVSLPPPPQPLMDPKDEKKKKEEESKEPPVEKYLCRIHLDSPPYPWIRDIADKYIPELSLGLGSWGVDPNLAKIRNTLSTPSSPASASLPSMSTTSVGSVGGIITSSHASSSLSVPSNDRERRASTSTDSLAMSEGFEIIGLQNAFQIIAHDDVYVFDFPDFDTKVKYICQITDNIHEYAKNATSLEYSIVHNSGLIPYPFYTNLAYLSQKVSSIETDKKKKRASSTTRMDHQTTPSPTTPSPTTTSSASSEEKKKGIFRFFKSKKHLKEEKTLSTQFENIEMDPYEINPEAIPNVSEKDIPDSAHLNQVKERDITERFYLAQAINTYRPHRFFNHVGVGQVDSKGVMSFHRGDVLIIFEKPNNDFVLAKKAGLNSDPDRRQKILESYIPRDFETLKNLMNIQKNREGINAGDPPAVKQLRRVKHHFVQIRDLLNELLEYYSNGGNQNQPTNVRNSTAHIMGNNSRGDDLLSKMDLLSLFESSNERKKSTSSTNLDKEREISAKSRKSLSTVFGDSNKSYENDEEESLFRNLINLYEEWNEVGLVPVKYIDEFKSHSTSTKLEKVIEWRNEQEERKIRNFVIKKKKATKAVEIDDLGVSCSSAMMGVPRIDTMKEKEVSALLKKTKKQE